VQNSAKLHQNNNLATIWQQTVKFFTMILQILKEILDEIAKIEIGTT